MAVNIAVIGGGKWGKNHIRIFSEIDCNLIGLSDVDPQKKILADEYGIKFETDYKKFLPLVDAVSIVVPTDLHYKIAKDCLLSGKHVFIEKPMTLDTKSARELIDLANKKKLLLTVGYLFKFNAATLELKKHLNTGDVQYITARYIHSDKPPRKDCGVIFNFATHLIDVLNFILDEKPKKIFCKKLNYLSKDMEDVAFVTLDYGNFIVNLEVSWFHPLKKRDAWIIGSKEKIYIDFLEQILIRYPIQINYDKTISEKEIIVEIHKNEPLKEELKWFCDSIKNNKNIDNEREYSVTKICEMCLESANTGKEIIL